eukprot:3532385-Heterocapsa_arctica.AAC.1
MSNHQTLALLSSSEKIGGAIMLYKQTSGRFSDTPLDGTTSSQPSNNVLPFEHIIITFSEH